MKNLILAMLLLVAFSVTAQDAELNELDQIFVDNEGLELIEDDEPVTSVQWTKENTASTFITMKEKMTKNKGPIMLFVIDGGDIYETENLINFMNSREGRSFRVYINYMVIDSRDMQKSPILNERFRMGNVFLVEENFKTLAYSKIDYYKTKTGPDWWSALQSFVAKNEKVISEASNKLRDHADPALVKTFDESLQSIKEGSFRERRKATKTMKSLVKNFGFLLMPICSSSDPEMSETANKLLLQTQTRVKFPLSRTIPLTFNMEKQLASFIKK
ncbi:MAG: hypothetical protein NE330_07310 [Lentisphaeraceae bacterium]|nr:hypothetical protein [Lentisphaeraceae bacterium]